MRVFSPSKSVGVVRPVFLARGSGSILYWPRSATRAAQVQQHTCKTRESEWFVCGPMYPQPMGKTMPKIIQRTRCRSLGSDLSSSYAFFDTNSSVTAPERLPAWLANRVVRTGQRFQQQDGFALEEMDTLTSTSVAIIVGQWEVSVLHEWRSVSGILTRFQPGFNVPMVSQP